MACDKLISIVVPIYKVEKYLPNCLNSLINQTYQNWEAILVDDGSPDRSGEICDEYAARDNRFKVIHKKNGGLSSARNASLRFIRGDYVLYLDSDDFIHNQALEYLYGIAIDNNADIVQCDYVRGEDSVFPSISLDGRVDLYDNRTIFKTFASKINTCGKLYKRDVIGEIKFPEGVINEDDFTTWKFYYRAKRIAITSVPLYYYTINPHSIMANKRKCPNFKYFDAYRERIEFFRNCGEADLEAVSRIQWMKSIVMTTTNPLLSDGQRREIREAYRSNYLKLYQSEYKVPLILDMIFRSYKMAPRLVSKIVNKLYKN